MDMETRARKPRPYAGDLVVEDVTQPIVEEQGAG
jgi:hypothetical protein